jgi:hypothetical protein
MEIDPEMYQSKLGKNLSFDVFYHDLMDVIIV